MKQKKKQKRSRPKRAEPMYGQMGSGAWDAIKGIASDINKGLKETKILSSVASLIPPGTPYIGQAAMAAAPILRQMGYGPQIGRGLIQGPYGSIISTPNPAQMPPPSTPVGILSLQSGRGARRR